MALEILSLPLGPMENNSHLVADNDSGEAVVVDPSFESDILLDKARQHGWHIQAIWLTHAHFDHIAGIQTLCDAIQPAPPVGLHPDDLELWRQGGGARIFGLLVEPGPEPTLRFAHGQILKVGQHAFEVRHTPGHTPGHVVFYCAEAQVVLCGDLIFYRGVGRTDLPGGNHTRLLESIRGQVLNLPPGTRLLSGHGPETNVEEEAAENPFL